MSALPTVIWIGCSNEQNARTVEPDISEMLEKLQVTMADDTVNIDNGTPGNSLAFDDGESELDLDAEVIVSPVRP